MQKASLLIMFVVLAFFLAGCIEPATDMANEAIKQNNPSLCNTLNASSEKTDCFTIVADQKKDPKICLQSLGPPEDCLVEYAIKNRVMTPCDLLTDAVKKYTCIAKFTGDQTGRALDVIIGDWKTKGLVTKCLDQCKAEEATCFNKCIKTYGDIPTQTQETCISDCQHAQWDECEPPCNDLANK